MSTIISFMYFIEYAFKTNHHINHPLSYLFNVIFTSTILSIHRFVFSYYIHNSYILHTYNMKIFSILLYFILILLCLYIHIFSAYFIIFGYHTHHIHILTTYIFGCKVFACVKKGYNTKIVA